MCRRIKTHDLNLIIFISYYSVFALSFNHYGHGEKNIKVISPLRFSLDVLPVGIIITRLVLMYLTRVDPHLIIQVVGRRAAWTNKYSSTTNQRREREIACWCTSELRKNTGKQAE